MLVEDDNNLREIYEARLLAEGYEIISAKDGEEALALAVKERPNLIISDIMMPNISGFDMLDILRSTPETKNTKVIMMTALSQAEDKVRANKLGADRYLVKSQVTLEDVVKVAKEVLEGTSDTPPTDIAASIPPSPAAASKGPAPSAVEKPTEPAGGNKSEQKPPQPVEVSTPETPKQEKETTADNTSGETTGTTPVDTTPKKPLQNDQPTATVPTPAEPTTAPNSNLEEDNSTGNDTIQTLPVVEVNENSSGDTAKNQTENAVADKQPTSKPAEKATNGDTSKETEGQDSNLPDDIAATTTPPPLPEPEVVKPNEHNTPISTASETSLDEDDKPPTVLHTKVIKPLSDFKKQKTDFEALVAKEEAKETGATAEPVVQDVEPVKEGGEAPSPQTITPTNENVDPNSVAL